MASIKDIAKRDWQRFTSDPNGHGGSVAFAAPTGEEATIVCLYSVHHLSVDTEGRLVNSRNANISVSEALLIAAGYPVRNDNDEVNLKNHLVTLKVSTGTDKQFIIREWWPDETVGMLVCKLGDYQ